MKCYADACTLFPIVTLVKPLQHKMHIAELVTPFPKFAFSAALKCITAMLFTLSGCYIVIAAT
jgi:hypothetical protein